ncbi:hypothetical protein J2S74_002955 [Evansella vedderi]|uniref:DNA methylase adenine-specific domain-containing protein n=1 Tax=Evansella vedderi TaxID=38282 RepID=A0ABT9ZWH4_9BACI|nr:hypothetical protein [Evansella vedderi]MDQ0255573.1 hypothetical protein [Evansella vedderi]
MSLSEKLIYAFESEENFKDQLKVIEGSSTKKKISVGEKALNQFFSKLDAKDILNRQTNSQLIEAHPLYIAPPTNPISEKKFGWNRGITMKLETLIRGRWLAWFNIINKGRLDPSDNVPDCPFSDFEDKDSVNKMLEKCMNHAYAEGKRAEDFLDWVGYSLGIAWFNRKPRISDKLWSKFNEEFDITLMLMYPSDYLSHFLSEHGAKGLAGYFPTPINITQMMNKILEGDDNHHQRIQSVFEPTAGAGAMTLPSNSLNIISNDLNPLMVKAAAIQYFLYLPWALYVPQPVFGLHFSEEEQRMNTYFEFNTNTRLYCGDALIGEFTAPKDIFNENSVHIDVYVHPLDLSKREIFKYENEMSTSWDTLANEMKWEITKAQCREFSFSQVLSNPPFGKMNKFTKERIREIEEANIMFLKEREEQLKNNPPHPAVERIKEEVKIKLNEHDGQFAFVL